MLRIPRTTNYDSDGVPVDPFWNVGAEKERKMHRIHAYPSKFPAFITTKALQHAYRRGLKIRLVADIFCGCGTVAYEAKRSNIPFWGCDINPVATLIAKAKSQCYYTWRLMDYFARIEREFLDSRFDYSSYKSANERIKYWFDAHSYHDLERLKGSIGRVISPRSKYHTFFMVAFSNILKPCSGWLTKSIKPQLDPRKARVNVLKTFRNQCYFSILANDESDADNVSKVQIETADFLAPNLQKPKVDLIVTSPPYVTSYEYADLHQLSALWLNCTHDYRELRSGSIGSHHRDSDFATDLAGLNRSGKEIVSRLSSRDKSKAKSVAKYYIDMQAAAKNSHNMLTRRGLALFIIGNTKYSGVRIDNARHLIESLYSAGFKDVEVTKRKISKKILTPYRDGRGRFTSDGRGRKVYSEEFIVIGQR